ADEEGPVGHRRSPGRRDRPPGRPRPRHQRAPGRRERLHLRPPPRARAPPGRTPPVPRPHRLEEGLPSPPPQLDVLTPPPAPPPPPTGDSMISGQFRSLCGRNCP